MNKITRNLLMTTVLAFMPIFSHAIKFEVDGIYYKTHYRDEYRCLVTKKSSRYSGDVNIPSSVTYDGTVYSVTTVEEHAFDGCTGLTSVTIPGSVTSIGGYAFSGCSGLTNITIPSSVTDIGPSCFSGCVNLEILVSQDNTVYSSIDGILFNKDATELLCFPGKGTEYTIPDSVTSIGILAFSGCTGLTSVTIPGSVTNIGDDAFSGCTGLTNITIPSSVTYIGPSCFSGCVNLEISVSSDNTVYSSIDGILFNKDATELLCFPGKGTEYTIPDSVTSIGILAFFGCTGLTSVTIPGSVTNIGDEAFSGCTGLTDITILDGVTSIGVSAFRSCSGLTGITIPGSVTSIGGYAFYGCTALTSITIPGSVTSIGFLAFSGCTGLTSVTIPGSVTSIGRSAFLGCSGLTSVTIPSGVTYIGPSCFANCTNLEILVSPDNTVYSSIDGILFNKDATELLCFPNKGTEYTIPGSVTSIEESAFFGCTGLTSVTIPGSVTSIEGSAFFGCTGLTDIINLATTPQVIPNSHFSVYGNLHVLPGYEDAYRNADVWKNFNIIGDADVTAVEGIK